MECGGKRAENCPQGRRFLLPFHRHICGKFWFREKIPLTISSKSGVGIRSVSPDTVRSSSLVLMITSAWGCPDSTRLGAVMAFISMLAWQYMTGRCVRDGGVNTEAGVRGKESSRSES